MTSLHLAFHAETGREAREKAEAWGLAEPNVAKLVVDAVRRPFPDRPTWYSVTVTVTFREREQGVLGL